MPSVFRHRLIMITAMVAGGLVWASAADVLRAADGSAGVSLMGSALSPAMAAGLAVAAGIPALLLSTAAAASRRVTSGLLAFSICLCVLAIAGGPIDGWLHRASLPGAYVGLIGEMVVWQVLVIGAVMVLGKAARILREHFPTLSDRDPQHGPDLIIECGLPSQASVFSCVLCAVISGALVWLFLRTTASGQVVGAMVLGFGVGSLIAQMLVPRANPAAVLFSPALVAIAGYGLVLMRFDTPEQVLSAWYRQMDNVGPVVPPPALALPIFYASAAMAGVCFGTGLGRSAEEEEGEESAAASAWNALFRGAVGKDAPKK